MFEVLLTTLRWANAELQNTCNYFLLNGKYNISYYYIVWEYYHVSLAAPIRCKIDSFYYVDIVGIKW